MVAAATIGAAVIGAGGSMLAAGQQSDAIEDASNASNAASNASIQLQREQNNLAQQTFATYRPQGDYARNQMAAFIGAPQTTIRGVPTAYNGVGTLTPVGLNTGVASGGYVPEQDGSGRGRAFLERRLARTGGELVQPEIGGFGNPALATDTAPMDTTYTTPDQAAETAAARSAAWENYQQSPWAAIGRTTAKKAQDSFLSLAGAQGSTLSGRTARGMAEVANEAEQGAFGSYYSALGGFADQGFAADQASVNSGLAFANNAGGIMTSAANNASQAAIASAGAAAQGYRDVAGWGGWALGRLGNGTSNNPGTFGNDFTGSGASGWG